MSEKIKKSFSQCLATFALIVISVLVLLNATGTDFSVPEVKAGAATSSASGQVGNASPSVSAVNVTSDPITLTENSTTSITITGTVTDTNGGSDISAATATLYAISSGDSCSANDNNCYTNITCTLGTVSGNDRNATCTTNSVYFHADPGSWGAKILASDASAASGSATDTTPSTINTLLALIVSGTISYDTLNPGANMTNLTKEVTATTTGNAAIDVQIKGDDMTGVPAGTITITNQRYATSSVLWASGNIATSTYQNFEVDLGKPTSHPSTSTDIVYWGWAVPGGTPIGTYTGTNYFNPISD
jgi:hypothetical protein